MSGLLWRDVINMVGSEYPTPDVFWLLCNRAAVHHKEQSYFVGKLGDHLGDDADRRDTLQEIRTAMAGYNVWRKQLDHLVTWASAARDPSPTEKEVEDWWFGSEKDSDLEVAGYQELESFLALIELPSEVLCALELDSPDRFANRYFVHSLKKNLHWLDELSMLRNLADKTWPADIAQRQPWTHSELRFVEDYYADQQPLLNLDRSEHSNPDDIDPFCLRPVNEEQSLGFGLDGLSFCMYLIMRATVIDFMNEILETSQFPQKRGSLRCIECGDFVGRRALGYGQLYCGQLCKKRSAKRRLRAKKRSTPILDPTREAANPRPRT